MATESSKSACLQPEEIPTKSDNSAKAETNDSSETPLAPSSSPLPNMNVIETEIPTPLPLPDASVSNNESTTAPSALEELSKNTETMEKLESIGANSLLKTADIIAYKVFTPSFEKSGYIIAIIEEIHIPDGETLETVGMNYDLTVDILGKRNGRFLMEFFI